MSTSVVKESFTTADLAIVPPQQASPIVLLKGDPIPEVPGLRFAVDRKAVSA